MFQSICVRTEFGEDQRFVSTDIRPLIHLFAESHLSLRQIGTAHDIPAIVAVEGDNVAKLCAGILARCAVDKQRASQRTLLRIQFSCEIKEWFEIIMRLLVSGFGLIENGECDDGRMILIAYDHLLQCVSVICLQLRNGISREETGVFSACAGCRKVHE